MKDMQKNIKKALSRRRVPYQTLVFIDFVSLRRNYFLFLATRATPPITTRAAAAPATGRTSLVLGEEVEPGLAVVVVVAAVVVPVVVVVVPVVVVVVG